MRDDVLDAHALGSKPLETEAQRGEGGEQLRSDESTKLELRAGGSRDDGPPVGDVEQMLTGGEVVDDRPVGRRPRRR